METGNTLADLREVFFIFEGVNDYTSYCTCSHSFPTPDGVEKAIENYLHRTGGAAPP